MNAVWRPPELPKSYWSLWRLLFVNRLLSFAMPLLSPFLLVERHVGVDVVAVCVAAFGVGAMAGSLLGAEIGVRWGPRTEVVVCFAGTGLVIGSLPWVPTLLLVPVCLLLGTFANSGRPGMTALMIDAAGGPDQRLPALTMMSWATNLAMPIAMIFAGVASFVSLSALFATDAAVNLACGATALRICRDPVRTGTDTTATRVSTWSLVVRTAPVLLAVLAVFAGLMNLSAPLSLRVLEYQPSRTYALLLVVNGVLLASGQLLSSRHLHRVSSTRWLVAAAAVLGCAVAATGVARTLPAFAGIVAAITLAQVVLPVLLQERLAARVPSDELHRAMGLFGTCIALAAAIGPSTALALLHASPTAFVAGSLLVATASVVGIAASTGPTGPTGQTGPMGPAEPARPASGDGVQHVEEVGDDAAVGR